MAAHQAQAGLAQLQQQQLAAQHLALMGRIVMQLQASPHAAPFNEPVPREVEGYHEVIHHPIDLGTIASRLQCGAYPSVQHVHQDIMLMFRNCYTFNTEGSDIFVCAQHLEHMYRQLCKEARFM
jgi:Bromodomain